MTMEKINGIMIKVYYIFKSLIILHYLFAVS